ncbi:hypothetical protein SKAU_G00372960 [Synaphobranchus kaupii]|uniref:Uncharacterized protein n=1 Tax=Synaphobranchus kaupii TaxID=118154 RepID=A0A9Q1EGH3_SYNKA|nr:hypothetical protein SKAU_G00372960 [Synaphobranchus kaupii]
MGLENSGKENIFNQIKLHKLTVYARFRNTMRFKMAHSRSPPPFPPERERLSERSFPPFHGSPYRCLLPPPAHRPADFAWVTGSQINQPTFWAEKVKG